MPKSFVDELVSDATTDLPERFFDRFVFNRKQTANRRFARRRLFLSLLRYSKLFASRQSGRSRLPTRSDQAPTAMRPSAPSSCDAVISTPAAPGDQPRSLISQTSPYVHTTNCGTTSSTDTSCTRSSREEVR